MAGRGLSDQQKWILRTVFWLYDYAERNATDYGRRMVEIWGIHWTPSRWHQDWTASDRASVSRALKRLEGRGLVLRTNDWGGDRRTNHVRLTEQGRQEAERLTKAVCEDVNR